MAESEWEAESTRKLKVLKIFEKFDLNNDGGLDRKEMAELVVAVNPRVKFKEEQIEAILDEVFRTYGEFIGEERGLSFDGLQRTYDDGAGDVDRDFEALNLTLDPSELEEPPEEDGHEEDKGGFEYASTKQFIDKLTALLEQHTNATSSLVVPSPALSNGLSDLRADTDALEIPDAALEAHMAFGRALMACQRPEEALPSLQRAVALDPVNVRAHFLCGNAYYNLGKHPQAKEAYESSLEGGKADPEAHATILPQVHVNLGIVLEEQGLLMGACEHYREAAILSPEHHRAMKLLGSALLGLGEYKAAEEALQNALFLRPDYPDAQCDLGSALHALGEDVRAGQAFESALAADPGHVDALYNLGGLLRDRGDFEGAVDTYGRVLAADPGHWQAQLNRSVALLGAGRTEEAERGLQEAFRMTRRVELYDAVKQLKRLHGGGEKGNRKLDAVLARIPDEEGVEGGITEGVPENSYFVMDPAAMRFEDPTVSTPKELSVTLDIRGFQRFTRLSNVHVDDIRLELGEALSVPPSSSSSASSNAPFPPKERMVRKSTVELLFRRLLPLLPPDSFIQSLRGINEKLISAVEHAGVVDLGLLLAVVAVAANGNPRDRKRIAFEALQWRRGRVPGDGSGSVHRRDAEGFTQLLRQVYLPGEPLPERELVGGQGMVRGSEEVGLPEFEALVDEYFPVLFTLLKLEMHDRTRHIGMSCAVCRCSISGLRYREAKARFDLCSTCYSERKAPSKYRNRKSYSFVEYVSGTDKVREKLGLYGRTLSKTPTRMASSRGIEQSTSQDAGL